MLFILDGNGVPSVSALIALRTPDGGVPKSPGSLVATTISSSQINLKWTDTSNSENEFMIERSLDGSSFTQITTVPKNTVKYSDAGLSPDTLYYYRVRANNNRGNSGYSNTVSRRTQA
jgi:phosphodiesterase/alkaline phosphatase D-like protein